jgi:hypothetical protein
MKMKPIGNNIGRLTKTFNRFELSQFYGFEFRRAYPYWLGLAQEIAIELQIMAEKNFRS